MLEAASFHITLAATSAVGSGGHGGSKSGVPTLVIGILFVVLGSINATNPRLQWRMRSWQFKNKQAQEPSDAALKVARVTGALFAIIGVVLIVVGITKL